MATTTNTELHTEAAKLCTDGELRYTTTRRAIVETLSNASQPLTIDEVLEQNKSLAQSSVYRNVEDLRTANIVAAVTADPDKTRFELAETLGHHHHHMVCTDCNSITGFELDHKIEELLDQSFDSAAQKAGFKAVRHTLDLHGLCGNCA